MKILVTGGAGFIGSNFLYHMSLKYPKYELVCLDLLTYAGSLSTIKPLIKENKIKFIKGDISDREFIFALFEKEKFDWVVNFAAETHVDRSILNPEIFLKTNILGTQVLMDASLKYNIKRFHQISTDEVYGDLPLDRPDLLFKETTPINTSSPYSASKASADLFVLAYNKTFKLPITISRCSNNYGFFQYPEKLIPLMIIKALNNEKLPVYGNGLNVRDWLFVEDHCKAVDLILHSGKIGEIYNIGGNFERNNLEIVKTILKALKKPESLISFVEDRKGHDLRYAINYSKINKNLGWNPTLSFEEGIKKTIKWYLENENWWKEVLENEQKS